MQGNSRDTYYLEHRIIVIQSSIRSEAVTCYLRLANQYQTLVLRLLITLVMQVAWKNELFTLTKGLFSESFPV